MKQKNNMSAAQFFRKSSALLRECNGLLSFIMIKERTKNKRIPKK